MPTYEYACTECGHHLEVSQSFSDEPLSTCPNCGGHLRKVFGSIGIVLKGSGFYRNDSRSLGATQPKKEKEAASVGAGDSSGASGSAGSSSSPSSDSSAKSSSSNGSASGSSSGGAAPAKSAAAAS